ELVVPRSMPIFMLVPAYVRGRGSGEGGRAGGCAELCDSRGFHTLGSLQLRNQVIVFSVRTNPVPHQGLIESEAQRAIAKANSDGPGLAVGAQTFELKAGVCGVALEHAVRPLRAELDFGWQLLKQRPELGGAPGRHPLRSSAARSCRRDAPGAPLLPTPRYLASDGSAPARRRVLQEPSQPKRLVPREAIPKASPRPSAAVQSRLDLSTTILVTRRRATVLAALGRR